MFGLKRVSLISESGHIIRIGSEYLVGYNIPKRISKAQKKNNQFVSSGSSISNLSLFWVRLKYYSIGWIRNTHEKNLRKLDLELRNKVTSTLRATSRPLPPNQKLFRIGFESHPLGWANSIKKRIFRKFALKSFRNNI